MKVQVRLLLVGIILVFIPTSYMVGQVDFNHPQIITTLDYEITDHQSYKIKLARINDDNYPDLVYSVYTGWNEIYYLYWCENLAGTGLFGPSQYIAEIHNRAIFDIGDVDNDMDMDIVANSADGLVWVENESDGTQFNSMVACPGTSPSNSIFSVDMDGDMDSDILCSDGDVVFWCEYSADASSFEDTVGITYTGMSVSKVSPIDFDSDGDMDVIQKKTRFRDDLFIYENHLQTGHFELIANFGDDGDWIPTVETIDVDQDNDMDFVTVTDNPSWGDSVHARLYENTNGMGSFTDTTLLFDFVSYSDNWDVLIVDVDNDGFDDILHGDYWYRNEFQSSTNWSNFHINDSVKICASDDIDHDGDHDLVGIAGNSIYWIENQGIVSGINPEHKSYLPTVELYSNFPNPFNSTTTLKYDLLEKSDVVLTIHDLLGRTITTVTNEEQPAGSYSTQWEGVDQFGTLVNTGVYFSRLQAGGDTKTIKMLLLK